MPQDLNVPADQPDTERPTRSSRPRKRLSARVVAVAGLTTVAIMGVVAPAIAAPTPEQTAAVTACVNDAAVRITAAAVALPANQRAAYIRVQIDIARTTCAAAATSPPTTTTIPTTTTTTTPPTTTTTTPTTSPTTTTTTAPGRYEVTVTGVLAAGRQTIQASCNAGDQLVSYRYQIGSPTGSNTSRNVSVDTNGTRVRVTYQVTGTVPDPTTSVTAVCRVRT